MACPPRPTPSPLDIACGLLVGRTGGPQELTLHVAHVSVGAPGAQLKRGEEHGSLAVGQAWRLVVVLLAPLLGRQGWPLGPAAAAGPCVLRLKCLQLKAVFHHQEIKKSSLIV